MDAIPEIADIRRQIDALDGKLRDLLLARARLVEQIGAVKAQAGVHMPLQPHREAEQIAALAVWQQAEAPHLPLSGLIAIWRELIGMAVAQQGGLHVHASTGVMAVAQRHFGASLTYQMQPDAAAALAALDQHSSVIAVISAADSVTPPASTMVFARLPTYTTGACVALACGAVDTGQLTDPVTLIRSPDLLVDSMIGTNMIFRGDGFVLAEIAGNFTPTQISKKIDPRAVWLGCYQRPLTTKPQS